MRSEEKGLTIKLAAAAPANFQFVSYNPPFETRELFATKAEYEAGEDVYVKFAIKNVGESAQSAGIHAKDIVTGDGVMAVGTAPISPGSKWKAPPDGIKLMQVMPNRDWPLVFTVTP